MTGGFLARPFALWALLAILPGTALGTDDTGLLRYEATEHAPVIRGRYDQAFQRALESAFRKTLVKALREAGGGEGRGDYAFWQNTILSRASDFIASYRILSQEESEGGLSLTVQTRIYREKLKAAALRTADLSPTVPIRVLILIDTYALAGPADGEDIDAGSLAAAALELEFLKSGAIIVPPPQRLPWEEENVVAPAENRISIATTEARRLGADFLVLGRLQPSAEKLLVLTAELISLSSLKTLASSRSPVELEGNTSPADFFSEPALETVRIMKGAMQLKRSSPGRKHPAPPVPGPG